MKFKLETYNRNTSEEELISDVKRVADILKRNTVTMSENEENGKFNPSTLTRKFGSWFKVLEVANLEASRSKLNISEEELFKNIESVWISLGRQPKYAEFKKPLSKYSAGTYENRFGSFGKALEAFVDYINNENGSESVNDFNETDEQISKVNVVIKHKTKREISERMRFRILLRDGFSCRKCGKSPMKEIGVELHVDHILPWSKGGETVEENLETKCLKCNLGKGNAFNV